MMTKPDTVTRIEDQTDKVLFYYYDNFSIKFSRGLRILNQGYFYKQNVVILSHKHF